jgi:hypothetical protein
MKDHRRWRGVALAISLALFPSLASAQPRNAHTEAMSDSEFADWMQGLESGLDAVIDRLLDAARTGADSQFQQQLVPPVAGDAQASLSDDRIGSDLGPLTLARLRPFATACARGRAPREHIFTLPPTHTVSYVCDGEAGYELYAIFNDSGTRIESISLWGPRSNADVPPMSDEERARIQASAAASEAEERAEVMRVAATVDTLFAAALAGDRESFQALLGRGLDGGGAALADDRSAGSLAVPLTLEALRPIAAECRRMPGDEPYQNLDMSDRINQEARFICNGVPGHFLYAGFEENGTRIGWLRLEGPVRRPFP